MADFYTAYLQTSAVEGGYSNNPSDKGGETYKGISRVNFPHWSGWDLVDQKKFTSIDLEIAVQQFYRTEFWEKLKGDNISSQLIANELFDTSVNMGTKIAGRFLQTALNALNRQGTLYPDITVDGGIGTTTLNALQQYLITDTEELLLKVLNILQGSRYIDIMQTNASQETFARGWFKRVTITK